MGHSSNPEKELYAVVLTASERDKYSHNSVFANELIAAFEALNVSMRSLDYAKEARHVSHALRDSNCLFFLCFNGFGSELLLTTKTPGELISAYEFYKKPLFDLMHDCPAHETMGHQLDSIGRTRNLLLTDYSYAHVARMLGIANVRAISSITFPATIGRAATPLSKRSIDVLLPIGLSSAESSRRRHGGATSYKDRLHREIFECVTEQTLSSLGADPLIEMLAACQQIGIVADFRNADLRFLLSSIVDYVKFKRRRELVDAVKHLPISVVSDHDLQADFSNSSLKFIGEQTFPNLLKSMTHSKSVICPLPHHAGFHERALGAFTAGALVVAAPNEILETHFIQGQDMLTYRSFDELAAILERNLPSSAVDNMQAMAASGQTKALNRFSPHRLASTILSLFESGR